MARILVVILGEKKPSSRLRILPLVDALRRRGHLVSLTECPQSAMGRLKLLRSAREHDLLLLQKKLFPSAYMALLKRANARLVFDVDDAIMFHEVERGEPLSGRYFQRFCVAASVSKVVVTGNRYLAEFAAAAKTQAKQGVHVLPTPIDTERLRVKNDQPQRKEIVVGWLGTKGNLAQLSPLRDVLRQLAQRHSGLRVRLITDGEIALPGVACEIKPWRADEEEADLHSFDIGIMPLDDNLWNRGKGGYKLLQYMAAGLSVVASPVGINAEIITHGANGLLAASAEEWLVCLDHLCSNPNLRKQLGKAGRATVEARFSLTAYLDRYLALLEALF